MEFQNLMQEVEIMFNSWLNDNELNEIHCGDVEALQQEFINCIQSKIKSNFVVMTEKQLNNRLHSYHCSMEGYEQ